MKLSEVTYTAPDYLAMNENKFTCRGYILQTFGFYLEALPDELLEPCIYVQKPSKQNIQTIYRKVYVRDIVGTSYCEYGGESWLATFLKVKRLDYYIKSGCVTKGKYLRMMKMPDFQRPGFMVHLSLTSDGLIVDGNGNHRVSTYKMMYLSDITCGNLEIVEKARRQYWLYAEIDIPNGYFHEKNQENDDCYSFFSS
ncbi:MAG: hypothetical protein LLF96_10370 [Eubacteriales bacterium]|nr:hypothetical protein [Eubacteriales bacterium]